MEYIEIPNLTLDMCQEKIDRDLYYPSQVVDFLASQEYKNLGWLNDGIFPPALDDWMELYRNQSGSYTIMVSHEKKYIYCVDMGD